MAASSRPIGRIPRRTKYFASRRPRRTSRTNCQKARRSICGPRASALAITFTAPGLNDNSEGVIIMFAPEGRVSRVSYSQMPDNRRRRSIKPVVDNVYLLVGRRENIAAPDVATADPTLNSRSGQRRTTDEERAKLRKPLNWLGGGSRWVVIGSQSGRIATIENAFVDMAGVIGEYHSAV